MTVVDFQMHMYNLTLQHIQGEHLLKEGKILLYTFDWEMKDSFCFPFLVIFLPFGLLLQLTK